MRTHNNTLTFDKLDNDKLRDFFNLLGKIKSINEILTGFSKCLPKMRSRRLKALVTMRGGTATDEVALFPEINTSIAEFEALIVWQTGQNNERVPEPFEGIDADYDRAKKRVSKVYRLLE
jgi:hypothetical protein